jgi:hypothetical protein
LRRGPLLARVRCVTFVPHPCSPRPFRGRPVRA